MALELTICKHQYRLGVISRYRALLVSMTIYKQRAYVTVCGNKETLHHKILGVKLLRFVK